MFRLTSHHGSNHVESWVEQGIIMGQLEWDHVPKWSNHGFLGPSYRLSKVRLYLMICNVTVLSNHLRLTLV